MKRRTVLQGAVLALLCPVDAVHAALPAIDVYKSASCGCCHDWVEHLQSNGFTVKVHDVANPSAYRAKFGVPHALGSCHTAVIDGYAIEGHVPAREIKQLLAERPKAKGLAVPSMLLGSPGMEGLHSEPYDVLLFQADGRHAVYQHYAASGSNQMSPSAGAADGKRVMSEGEVRKVDKGAGKITIKHGPLLNLDMPGMTMVFRVSKAALLDQVKSGDKIKFVADKTDGTLTILHIEPVK
jgi:hypothetical protein